jgi:cell volume regulation protein A
MTAADLPLELLVGAGTVIAAVVAARLAHSLGLPALLVFLGLGLALGESGAGIQFSDAGVAEVLGLGALILILAEGGLTTNWSHARPAMGGALLLATVGVVVATVVVAALAHWLLGFGWRSAFLLGAVLAPTDAAAVFSVLRRLPLPPSLSGMLEGESGLNDPPSVLAVTLLSSAGNASAHGTPSPWLIAGEVVWELAGGCLIGLAVGLVGVFLLRRAALPSSGLYPVAVLGLIVAAYGAASLGAASGFLAVYVTAVVLGNTRLPHHAATRGFAEGIGWLSQIGLFVMLGLLAAPSRLPAQILPALAVGVVAVFLARPAAVAVALAPLRLGLLGLDSLRLPRRRARPRRDSVRGGSLVEVRPSWREQAFLSWAGLRGAVPIVLTTIPLSSHVPGATRLFDIVFLVVVMFTMLQGPTLPWAAARLGVTAPAEPLEIEVEAAPLEEMHADLLQVQIPDGSRLHGVEVFELRLPTSANLALIVRGDTSLVPDPATMLRCGDRLLIVCPAAVRSQVERRIRAVSRAGKLAGWFGEQGA